MNKEKRNYKITIRFSASELEAIQAQANSQKLPTYLRQLILHRNQQATSIPRINQQAYGELTQATYQLHQLVSLLERATARQELSSVIDSQLMAQLKKLQHRLQIVDRSLIGQ